MAQVYSTELHRTWDLNPNEAYFGCGTSGFISRLNAPKFQTFPWKAAMLHPARGIITHIPHLGTQDPLASSAALTHTSTLPCPSGRLGPPHLLLHLPA